MQPFSHPRKKYCVRNLKVGRAPNKWRIRLPQPKYMKPIVEINIDSQKPKKTPG